MCILLRDVIYFTFIQKLNKIGEGVWYHDTWRNETVLLTPGCTACVGIAMIALRNLKVGDELFLDYKYDLKDPSLPEWYVPVKY